MSQDITLALDAMGGLRAPDMVLRGADMALQRHPGLRFRVYGAEPGLRPLLAKLPRLAGAIVIVDATSAAVAKRF